MINKMDDSFRSVRRSKALYIIFFISYILCGVLLSKVSFQAQVVPVWIPAGIALVGCYIWWWRFFPAVFLASFIFNCSVSPSFEFNFIFSQLGIQNSLIAVGSMLQAIVGAALLRSYIGNPLNEWDNKKTVAFIFLVGISTNVISASVGIFSLNTFNPSYSGEVFGVNMIYWWLGDSLGVMLATPLLLSLLNFGYLTKQQKRSNLIIIYSVSGLFLIVTAMTWLYVSASDIDTKNLVKKEVEVIENGIYRQLNNSINQLSELADFIQNAPNLTRRDFSNYVNKQVALQNTVKAMSWNPLIAPAQKKAHEANLQEIYGKPLTIRGDLLQVDDPIIYVKLISPENANQKAIGFNVYSNTSRKETLLNSLEQHQPKATPIIQLVQSEKTEAGFLLFYPVFKHVNSHVGQQVTQIVGFATGVFLAENMLNIAINEEQKQLFYYEFFEENHLKNFSSNTNTRELTLQDNPDHITRSFVIAGQTWNINLLVNRQYVIEQHSQSFLVLFLLQVSIVTIIMMFLLMMNNRHIELDKIVKERTESLNKAMTEAKQANKAKSQFLANMSHEIRTPMNGLIGFAQLAKQSDDMNEIKSYLEKIDISSDLLLHIVNDILDIAKIESEKLELTQDSFDVHESISRIGVIFENTALNKGLCWNIKDNLPDDLYVKGDQTRFEQVLMNLCGNAVKFTPHGSISLSADLIGLNKEQAHLKITIKDSGIGIAEHCIDKLFSPFIQEDTTTARDYGGTGLGLAISKELSKLMQGDITATSKLGEGTTFTFTCQLAIANEKPKSISRVSTKINTSQGVENLKVLVAEDNRVNQKLILAVLAKLGIKADIVENGQLAIDQVQRKKYDVILMDCQMPVLDGYDATKAIRSMPAYADLPIFALTADVDTRSKERVKEVGFDKHMSKPLNFEELLDNLKDLSR